MNEQFAEAQLVAQAQSGDKAAFNTLVMRHKTWLYRFVRRYVGDQDEAYDLLQDSFISAWNALSRFDVNRPLGAWLRQIALNKCRDYSRRKSISRALFAVFGNEAEQRQDPCGTTLERLGKAAAQTKIENAIARLPIKLKEPLVFTALEGWTHEETAQFLNLNAKTVESRVYRAKKILAAKLNLDDLKDIADES